MSVARCFLIAILLSTACLTPARAAAPVSLLSGDVQLSGLSQEERATADQPDDHRGFQVHVAYVLPSDGQDERLDTDGAIAGSVASLQAWLAQQTGGARLRFDTFQGRLDITFIRLSRTDAEIRSANQFVRDRIQEELIGLGHLPSV